MTVRYSLRKIDTALQLLAEFEAKAFPHIDSIGATKALKTLLLEMRQRYGTGASPQLVVQTEMETTGLIDQVLELLGVISNSANVRNSFEIHGPVRHLTASLLDDKAAMFIVSFEWSYIPYTYPQNHPLLPSFVIIGLPASEASNALVLPAIGHELGHSLWRKNDCSGRFEADINRAIITAIKTTYERRYNKIFSQSGNKADSCDDLKNVGTWGDAADYTFRQIEEIFSDFTGLFIFGGSYLDAFEYLLSPAISPERAPEYPTDLKRAEYLSAYAQRIGVSTDSAFPSRFESQSSPFRPESNDQLQMELADVASSSLVDNVFDLVSDLFKSRGISTPSGGETGDILANFLIGVPAENTSGMGAILNAGWAAFKDSGFMNDKSDTARMASINELVLKSVEVYEIERITRRGAKA